MMTSRFKPLTPFIRNTFLCLFLTAPLACDAQTLLAPVFSDHAVIQRDVPVRLRGSATPGESISVSMGPHTSSVVTGADGHWSVQLPAFPAGGPHELTAQASGGARQTVTDLLVGDVFLCTGQSNMAMQVRASTAGNFEAMRATDTRIRMLTVRESASPVPLDTFANPVAWEVASPETVPNWSATCYFFGRNLRNGPLAGDDVPVGLITAAWGGSSIRAWMSMDALSNVGGYGDALQALRDYTTDEPAAQQSFGKTWQTWWLGLTGGTADAAPWQPAVGKDWQPAPEGLGDYTQWDGLRGVTGMLWFRASFRLTREQASRPISLSIGAADEVDMTFVNGHVVANTFGYGTTRTYPVPASSLKEGENVVVINILNTWATGGLIGDHSLRAVHPEDGTRVELEDWRFDVVRRNVGAPPRAPWESVGGLSGIHNAMVAPLHDYPIRASLWYQGESNTGEGAEYTALMKALIGQWRTQFGTGPAGDRLPALIVQLPNFGALPTHAGESGWADVREAQRLAVMGDPAAAIAVTIDVGDAANLHPPNKQAVGDRLARAARAIVYGERLTPSGPVPTSAVRRDDSVVVTFTGIEEALVAYAGAGPIGFALCGDGPGTCRYADARIDGDRVRVRIDDDRPVTRIRYAWADAPIVTFFDRAGLPVGPFEMTVTQFP